MTTPHEPASHCRRGREQGRVGGGGGGRGGGYARAQNSPARAPGPIGRSTPGGTRATQATSIMRVIRVGERRGRGSTSGVTPRCLWTPPGRASRPPEPSVARDPAGDVPRETASTCEGGSPFSPAVRRSDLKCVEGESPFSRGTDFLRVRLACGRPYTALRSAAKRWVLDLPSSHSPRIYTALQIRVALRAAHARC